MALPAQTNCGSEPRCRRSCSATTASSCWTSRRAAGASWPARRRRAWRTGSRCCRGARTGPWLVHRLDADTSGCLLVALRRSALLAAQAEFAAGRARKTYWAVVRGSPLSGRRHDRRAVARGTARAAAGTWWRIPPARRAVTDVARAAAARTTLTWLELHAAHRPHAPGARSLRDCSAVRCWAIRSTAAVPAGCICWRARSNWRSIRPGRRGRTGAGAYARRAGALRLGGRCNASITLIEKIHWRPCFAIPANRLNPRPSVATRGARVSPDVIQ